MGTLSHASPLRSSGLPRRIPTPAGAQTPNHSYRSQTPVHPSRSPSSLDGCTSSRGSAHFLWPKAHSSNWCIESYSYPLNTNSMQSYTLKRLLFLQQHEAGCLSGGFVVVSRSRGSELSTFACGLHSMFGHNRGLLRTPMGRGSRISSPRHVRFSRCWRSFGLSHLE